MRLPLLLFLFVSTVFSAFSQGLYTARGYWEESTKGNFSLIKQKQANGDSLSADEQTYLQDYTAYLATYYQRLSEDEKQRYESLKELWDQELTGQQAVAAPEEFEWRTRDRVLNMVYGIYYGASLVSITGINSPASVGIPLIIGGFWVLGPVINPNKYEGINQSVVRASNTGKILGLGYGAALALAVAGESDDLGKWALGLSSLGSMAMGEVGFQLQKRKSVTEGHIEMMRHYGFLGPWIGFAAGVAAQSNMDELNTSLTGATLLAGGVSGLFIGNHLAKRYDYTKGDVDAINSLAWISTGIGFTATYEAINHTGNANALILIPAAASVGGTILAQKAVKGAKLTKKQGSTLSLASGGAALVGLGIVALTEEDSPALYLGVPSALALITHQILLHNFKMKNIVGNLQGSLNKKNKYRVALNFSPENYFLNKRIPVENFSPAGYANRMNPMVKLKITF